MLRSWKLGAAFGIDIYVHWTFPLLLLLFLVGTIGEGIAAVLFVEAVVLTLFGCLILHELGHALMARSFGIQTRDITIYPIGGVARLERMSEKPWQEFWIALAGPAVNVAIAGLLFVMLWPAYGSAVLPLIGNMGVMHIGLLDFLVVLLNLNLFLALFNMIPAFPMDGGRILRALLSVKLGQLTATEIAAGVGSAAVVLMVLAGFGAIDVPLLTKSPMLVFLALFVWFLGQQELAVVRYRAAARLREPVDVVPAHQFLDVSALPAEPSFSGFTWDRRAGVWIEWRDGRPVHACWVKAH